MANGAKDWDKRWTTVGRKVKVKTKVDGEEDNGRG